MTYIISTVNKQPPIDRQDATTGRLIREDDSEINFANWLTDIVTPGSGVGLNISGASMVVTVEQDEGNVLQNMQNGRVHFVSDFQQGLDTLDKFHLVYNGILTTGKVNDAATGGDGEVQQTNFQQGFLETVIDYNGLADTNQWVIQSQTSMKLGNYENTFVIITGRFRHPTVLGVLDIRITARIPTFTDAVPQTSWNINDMLSGTVTPSNPAGVFLDVESITTLIINIPLKDSGNVKFGFLINNEIVYAHEFVKTNVSGSEIALVNKPIRLEGTMVSTNQSNLKVGNFDQESGYFLEVRSTGNVGPLFRSDFLSASCFSIGANTNEYYRTVFAGTDEVLQTVTSTPRPLVSITPKTLFPPGVGSVNNDVIISLKEINISGASLDLNDGVFIELILNRGTSILTGPTNFNSVGVNSSVEFDIASTGIIAGGERIFARPIYPNKGEVILDVENVLSNFINKYTNSHIAGDGWVPELDIAPTITLVATSMTINSLAMSATMVWAEKA